MARIHVRIERVKRITGCLIAHGCVKEFPGVAIDAEIGELGADGTWEPWYSCGISRLDEIETVFVVDSKWPAKGSGGPSWSHGSGIRCSDVVDHCIADLKLHEILEEAVRRGGPVPDDWEAPDPLQAKLF